MRKSVLAVLALAIVAGAGYAVQRWPDQTIGWLGQRTGIAVQSQAAPGGGGSGGGGEGRQSASPVEVATSKSEQSVTELRSVGTLSSDESVSIAAEVAGRIAELRFSEGEAVKAGDVLVKLDDQLAQAELRDVEAALTLAESNFKRASALSTTGAGTGRALDEARAALGSSRAAVELARVRLDKTEIRAPFNGVVGLRSISPGAYVQIGQNLVNIEKIDTLKVDFRLPEVNLREVSVGMAVDIAADAFPNEVFSGRVYAIDPLVDVNGRAIRIRATIGNTDNRLRPGLFARVTVRGAARGEVVMVPEGAIVPRGADTFVFKVENGRAQEAKVRLGGRKNGAVEVLEGLAAEAVVVTAGQQRLSDGANVEVVQPAGPV
jgi:membrane fusion protein, multidrug efflux system